MDTQRDQAAGSREQRTALGLGRAVESPAGVHHFVNSRLTEPMQPTVTNGGNAGGEMSSNLHELELPLLTPGQAGDESGPPRTGTASAGPPVLLFPSLAGSVLECEESPVPGMAGERVWLGLETMLRNSDDGTVAIDSKRLRENITVQAYDRAGALDATRPFVSHMSLIDGKDPPGIVVRAKPGLAGCEYLSEAALVKPGTVILGEIANMLREYGYTEWDGAKGSMIGAAYDWRMTPAQLEARDGYFSSLVEQTEAMVAADPEHRPAVVIGFSLGCLIGKYFMHFCQAAKGDAWTASHLQHFVSLGGPFRGSVNLTRAVLVDGLFPPLNMLFNESQMLTILRSVPVGRYLQPIGDWRDGLDMPFIFLRDELYLRVRIGQLRSNAGAGVPDSTLRLEQDEISLDCQNSTSFHRERPFLESVVFVLAQGVTKASLTVSARDAGAVLGCGNQLLELGAPPLAYDTEHLLQLPVPPLGVVDLKVTAILSHKISQWDGGQEFLPANLRGHPAAQHNGGTNTHNRFCTVGCHDPRRCASAHWSPARPLALQAYDGLQPCTASEWAVPGSVGDCNGELEPPPCRAVTAIYGVGTRTPRALFLRHRRVVHRGGTNDKIESAFVMDTDGDVNGLLVANGVGYEERRVVQADPGSGNPVSTSGDGTVSYQSLRWPVTWQGACDVKVFELDGCDHRGVSTDRRMLNVLKTVLGVEHKAEGADSGQCQRPSRMKRALAWLADRQLCALVGKAGFQSLSVRYRVWFKWPVRVFVLLSLLICVFQIVYGVSMSYAFIEACHWGGAGFNMPSKIDALHEAGRNRSFHLHQASIEINFGILTYTHLGEYDYSSDVVAPAQLTTFSGTGCRGAPHQAYDILASERFTLQIFWNFYHLAARVNCAVYDTTMLALYDRKRTKSGFAVADPALFVAVGIGPGECIDADLGRPWGIASFTLTCGKLQPASPLYPVINWYRRKQQPAPPAYPVIDPVITSPGQGDQPRMEHWFGHSRSHSQIPAHNHLSRNKKDYGLVPLRNTGTFYVRLDASTGSCTAVTCGAGTVRIQNFDASSTLLVPGSHGAGSYRCGGTLISDDTYSIQSTVSENFIHERTFDVGLHVVARVSCYSTKAMIGRFVLVSNTRAKCVTSYKKCLEVGRDGLKDWDVITPHCTKGLEYDMCDFCYQAGIKTYVVLAVTILIQVPTIWISIRRTNAFRDTRLYKFMSVPICCLAIAGPLYSALTWKTACLDPMVKDVEDAVLTHVGPGYRNLGEVYTHQYAWSWSTLIASGLTFLVACVGLMTPVPDIYQQCCLRQTYPILTSNTMPA